MLMIIMGSDIHNGGVAWGCLVRKYSCESGLQTTTDVSKNNKKKLELVLCQLQPLTQDFRLSLFVLLQGCIVATKWAVRQELQRT